MTDITNGSASEMAVVKSVKCYAAEESTPEELGFPT